MLKSAAPTQYVIPWANSGTKNAIPVASQIGITNGAASYTDGYPPLTFTPIASGGVPPFGSDTNGILYNVTLSSLWQQSGFMYAYNSTFSTNQGGYPAQSLVVRSDGKGLWLNTTDSNTGNPDATGGNAGWLSVRANVGSTSIAVVAGNNTPDPSTLGPRLLIITGSIASTASLILPLTSGSSWVVYNTTSGAGSLSVQGATGSGVTVAQGVVSEVITDGTNFYTSTFNGSGVYLPINGTAVAATKLATARTIAMTGDVSWTSPAFDGTANVTAAGTITTGAVTLIKMAAFQANSLMGNPTVSSATPSAITLSSPLTFSGTTLALSYQPVNKAGDTMSGALNITTTGTNGLNISSSSTNSAGLQLINTAASGRTYTVGSFNSASGITGYGVYDGTASKFAMYIDSSNIFTNNGKMRAIASSGPAYDANIADNNWALIINDTNDTNTRGGVWRSSSTPGVALINVIAGFKGIWAYDNGTFATDGAFTVNGSLTSTGVANLNTSDRTLKDSIQIIDARPLHRRVDFTSYRRWDLNMWGKGLMAQDLIAEEPLYGGTYEHTFDDGKKAMKLGINESKAALEEAWWCGHKIDRIISVLRSHGIEVK